jgi:hypothetical protein
MAVDNEQSITDINTNSVEPEHNQVAEDEMGGPCSTNGGEEERL